MVVASGDRPRRSTCRPAILVCPKLAPCLAWPNTGRNSESMSTYAWDATPGNNPLRRTRLTRCARATDANCRVCPWVNSRRNWPSVAGAYTPAKHRGIPPERITSRSSILSAPAAIPATIEVILPAGFAPAEATLVEPTATLPETSSERPARSANAITGTRPAHDTRFSSSKIGTARDHTSGSFTLSAFWLGPDQELNTPDSSDPEGTST